MKPFTKNKPNFEAERVKVEADSIGKPEKTRRSAVHHAGRIKAKGDVKVTIRSQYPNSDNNPLRPASGTTFESDKVYIEARKVEITKDAKPGRDSATAKGAVGIFGKLRRR